MSKVALITGITGQDGSYLAELLLSKGYKVHGIVRRVALEDETNRLWRIRRILNEIHLHAGSLESYASLFNIIRKTPFLHILKCIPSTSIMRLKL